MSEDQGYRPTVGLSRDNVTSVGELGSPVEILEFVSSPIDATIPAETADMYCGVLNPGRFGINQDREMEFQ